MSECVNALVGLWWPLNLQHMKSPLSRDARGDKHPSQDRNLITEALEGWGEACRRRPWVLVPRDLRLSLLGSLLTSLWERGVTYHLLPLSEVLVRKKSRKSCVRREVHTVQSCKR